MWAACAALTERAAQLAADAMVTDGVRLASLKLLETAVLALTVDAAAAAAAGKPAGPPANHALLKPAEVILSRIIGVSMGTKCLS